MKIWIHWSKSNPWIYFHSSYKNNWKMYWSVQSFTGLWLEDWFSSWGPIGTVKKYTRFIPNGIIRIEYKNIMELFLIKYPKEQTLGETKIRLHKCTFLYTWVIISLAEVTDSYTLINSRQKKFNKNMHTYLFGLVYGG